MNFIGEAEEIIKVCDCKDVFPFYEAEMPDIVEISHDKKEEYMELKKRVDTLESTIEITAKIKKIECPLNQGYLEFSIDRTITPYDIDKKEYEKISSKVNPLLEKYNWELKERK